MPRPQINIQLPTYFQRYFKPKRFKGLFGGRGSGKSHCFATLLILRASQEKGFRAVCIREIQKSITDSSKQLLEDKIKDLGLEAFFHITDTEIVGMNDSKIIFRGMQSHNAKSIKSLEGMDVAWIEEAEAISSHSLTMLEPTIRKPGSEIWASWNPDKKTDAIDVFFRSNPADPDIICTHVNHSDNPWFPEELRKSMERDKRRDMDKYNHVWMGEYWGVSQSRIFKNYTVGIREVPQHAIPFFGIDWGFSNDPMAGVRAYFLDERTIYINKEVYEVGVVNERIPVVLGDLEIGVRRAYADNARPETIDYVRRKGMPGLRAAKKGPGSVEDGIAQIQGYDVVIHPDCINTKTEFDNYSYHVEKDGTITRVPVDKNNHLIDALRYALQDAPRKVKTEKPKPPPPPEKEKLQQPIRLRRQPVTTGSWRT